MNHHEASPPRALLALAALAMAAITIGAAVVVPAKLDASTPTDAPVTAAVTCTTVKDRS
jgi:hypothetical protein